MFLLARVCSWVNQRSIEVHRNFKNLEFGNINLIIKRSLFQMFTKGGDDPIQCMKIGSLKFNFGTN